MTIKRIRFLQALLDFIGLENRLHLEWISSAEAQKFARVVTDFTSAIKTLGPSPLKDIQRWHAEPLPESTHMQPPPAGLEDTRGRRSWPADRRLIETVKSRLVNGDIDVFLGYRRVMGHPLPYCFSGQDLSEVEQLVMSSGRYALEKLAVDLLAENPDLTVGLMARDCNQRALNLLETWDRIGSRRIVALTQNCCPAKGLNQVGCSYLKPETSAAGKQQLGIDNTMSIEALETMPAPQRLSRWLYEFQKCLKCYGCRNVCPVCFCDECSLEHDELVRTGEVPPEVPIFHLVRAVHMAGRCIDCGLCEEACPVNIPLRLLYRKVRQITAELFNYEAGTSPSLSPLSVLEETVTLKLKPMEVEPAN
jgi:ferredoxin